VRLHDISSCRCFFYFKYNIVTQISQVEEVLTRFSTLTVSNKSPLIILNASILIPGYLSKANVSLNDKNLRHHQLLKQTMILDDESKKFLWLSDRRDVDMKI